MCLYIFYTCFISISYMLNYIFLIKLNIVIIVLNIFKKINKINSVKKR